MTASLSRPLLDRVMNLSAVSDLRSGAREATLPDDEARRSQVAARMIWSSVVEPGDRVAHQLIGALGATGALRWLHDGGEMMAVDAVDPADQTGVPNANDLPDPAELSEGRARWMARLEAGNVVAQLEAAARVSAQVVIPGDAAWPTGLGDLGNHAPHALWVRGDQATLERLTRSIAIVGARASTGYGEHVTMELVAGLVGRQFTIVSGAAYGIDGMAHRAALADEGDTVAVLAGGIDRLYPSGHDALLQRIIANGAVVTEMPPGFSPTKWRFLQRNRLIAAMTQATVVVEAGWRSGSLNTAHHAVQLGRPLGVVPGPVTSAASAGCHRLLREEPATCVTSADEIVELVDGMSARESEELAHLGPSEQRALDALSDRARSVTELAIASGMSPLDVQGALGLLDIRQLAEQTTVGWRRRRV